MEVKVLGPGCRNCAALEARTREALENLGLEADIVKVTDVLEIASLGVMRTPALVVDDELAVAGRVPTVRALEELLSGRAA
jgi:small redox-active disulfide protein 2